LRRRSASRQEADCLRHQVVKDPKKSTPTRQITNIFFNANPQDYPTKASREETENAIDKIFANLIYYHGEKVQTGQLSNDQIPRLVPCWDEKLNWYIIAVSLGSVFFGAMNLHRQRAEFHGEVHRGERGGKCPSFSGIGMYSLPILLPILILGWAIIPAAHAGVVSKAAAVCLTLEIQDNGEFPGGNRAKTDQDTGDDRRDVVAGGFAIFIVKDRSRPTATQND